METYTINILCKNCGTRYDKEMKKGYILANRTWHNDKVIRNMKDSNEMDEIEECETCGMSQFLENVTAQ